MVWHCWLGIRKSIGPVKTDWWGTGMIICLEQGANNLHLVQLMPLSSIISCFTRIQKPEWFTFLVLAYPGCPGKEAIKWMFLSLLLLSGMTWVSCYQKKIHSLKSCHCGCYTTKLISLPHFLQSTSSLYSCQIWQFLSPTSLHFVWSTSIGITSYGHWGTCPSSIFNNLFFQLMELHEVCQRQTLCDYLCKHLTVHNSNCCSLVVAAWTYFESFWATDYFHLGRVLCPHHTKSWRCHCLPLTWEIMSNS